MICPRCGHVNSVGKEKNEKKLTQKDRVIKIVGLVFAVLYVLSVFLPQISLSIILQPDPDELNKTKTSFKIAIDTSLMLVRSGTGIMIILLAVHSFRAIKMGHKKVTRILSNIGILFNILIIYPRYKDLIEGIGWFSFGKLFSSAGFGIFALSLCPIVIFVVSLIGTEEDNNVEELCVNCGKSLILEISPIKKLCIVLSVLYGISVSVPLMASINSGTLLSGQIGEGIMVIIMAVHSLRAVIMGYVSEARILSKLELLYFLLVIFITASEKFNMLPGEVSFNSFGPALYLTLIYPLVLYISSMLKEREEIPSYLGMFFSSMLMAAAFSPVFISGDFEGDLSILKTIIEVVIVTVAALALIASFFELRLFTIIMGSIAMGISLITIVLSCILLKFPLVEVEGGLVVLSSFGIGFYGLILSSVSIFVCGLGMQKEIMLAPVKIKNA